MVGTKFSPNGTANASLEAVITGTGKAIAMQDCRQISWRAIHTGSAPTTGTLLVESAPTSDYAGTWFQLDSIACGNLSAGTEGLGTTPGPIGFVRARFSVNSDQPVTLWVNGLLG